MDDGLNIMKNTPLFDIWFEIASIKCAWLNENLETVTPLLDTQTWTILFRWDNMSLSWSCDNISEKILEIAWSYKEIRKDITINTLNWLTEIWDKYTVSE